MSYDDDAPSAWHRPRRWLLLGAGALAALVLAASAFDDAFPIVGIELDMDRAGALERARERAAASGWQTEAFRQAASFRHADREAQRYVEMEGGGPEAWLAAIESGTYHPYRWTVRQFEEHTTREARIAFTPAGVPYAFRLSLPEDEPGPSLSEDEARALAEAAAVTAWSVDLGQWRLVESSQEVQPGGRSDHTFVYERIWTAASGVTVADLPLGDARYRLTLGVGGAELTEVRRYIEVPEAFTRRYAEMRSANDLIALLATLVMGVLYLVLGCGMGLFLMMRQGWLTWRMALTWAAVVAVLLFGSALNQMPLAWLRYDTAVSVASFRAEQIMGAVMVLVGGVLFLGIVFMAGESLTRRALPRLPQLWRLWSRGVANSDTALGMTLGGYVIAAFDLAYVVSFYMFATRVLGWSISPDALLDPDTLATPLPWISGTALSLMAGFSEEVLFRAVPLAGAVLLGRRFGRPAAWITAAVFLQALIFAAAHANYPQQPAYARVVEIFPAAVAFGVIYLRFGLLPGIIGHFVYDLVLFTLPLFATEPLAALPTKLIVVAAGLTPLLVVLGARARWGARPLPVADALNGAWRPRAAEPGGGPAEAAGRAAAVEPGASAAGSALESARWASAAESAAAAEPAALAPTEASEPARSETGPSPSRAAARLPLPWVVGAALAGILLWAWGTDFSADAPPMRVGAGEARAVAEAAVAQRGVDPSGWRALPTVASVTRTPHRFVWETTGPEAYDALLGSFLAGPHWDVRLARFEGSQDERAEEWRVWVDAEGDVARVIHTLPEARPAPTLSQEDAHARALEALEAAYGYAPAVLRDVSAEARQRPERGDWLFIFEAPAPVALDRGETRAVVEIAGDEVVDIWRRVHIPEDWEREQRATQAREGLFHAAGAALLGLLVLAVVGLGMVRWARHGLPARVLLLFLAGFLAWLLVRLALGWPATVAGFSTSEPFGTQAFSIVAGMLFMGLLGGGALGALAGLGHTLQPQRAPALRHTLAAGLALGLLGMGITRAVGSALPGDGPIWPGYGALESLLPAVEVALSAAMGMAVLTIALLVVAGVLRRLAARRPALAAAAALLLGVAIAAAGFEEPAWTLAVDALLVATLLYGVYLAAARLHPALLPAMAAGALLPGQLHSAVVAAFPGASAGALLAAGVVLAMAVAWSRWLAHGAEASASGATAGPGSAPAGSPHEHTLSNR